MFVLYSIVILISNNHNNSQSEFEHGKRRIVKALYKAFNSKHLYTPLADSQKRIARSHLNAIFVTLLRRG